MGRKVWVLTKTAVFTVIMPGTIAGYLPYGLSRADRWQWPAGVWFAALPILALGAALYVWCVWRFASDGLGTPAPIDPPRTLVIRGPYRFTRNPMYVAVLSVIAGEAVLVRSATLLTYGAVVFVGFFLFVVAYEEPVLRAKFGASYEDYCAAVPRWIPRRRGSRTDLVDSMPTGK